MSCDKLPVVPAPELLVPFLFQSFPTACAAEASETSQQVSPFPSWNVDYDTADANDMKPFQKLEDNLLLVSEHQPLSHPSHDASDVTHHSYCHQPQTSQHTLLPPSHILPTFTSSVPTVIFPPHSPVIQPTALRVNTDVPAAHQTSAAALARQLDESTSARLNESSSSASSSGLFSSASTASPATSASNPPAQFLVKTLAPPPLSKSNAKASAKKVQAKGKRVPKPQLTIVPQENSTGSTSLSKRELQSRLDHYEALFVKLDTMATKGQVSLGKLKREIHDIARQKTSSQADQAQAEHDSRERRRAKAKGNLSSKEIAPPTSRQQQPTPASTANLSQGSGNNNVQSSLSSSLHFHRSDQRSLHHELPVLPQQQSHPSVLSHQFDLNTVVQLQQRQVVRQFSQHEDELRFMPYSQPEPSMNRVVALTDPSFADFRAASPFKKRKMEHYNQGAYEFHSNLSTLPYDHRRGEQPVQAPVPNAYPYFANNLSNLPAAAELHRAGHYRPMSRQGSEHSDIAAFQYLHVNGATPAISLSSSNPVSYFTRF